MRKILFSLIFVLTSCVVAFSQTNETAPCPTLSVTGPAGVTVVGETMTFTANVNKENAFAYNWTVSDGTIIEGLETPIIKVATNPDIAEKEITATVEIVSPNCKKTASEKAFVTRGNFDPIVADEYEKLSDKDEKARLENIAVQLKQNKDLKAYFLVYLPENNRSEAAKKRISKIKNYLVKNQGISEERIIILANQADFSRTRIYLVPSDAVNSFSPL